MFVSRLVLLFSVRGRSAQLILEAVTVAADIDGDGLVQEAVEEGRGEDMVREDVAPLVERLVGGENDAAALITSRDKLEQEWGGALVEGKVANFVQDQDLRTTQGLHTLRETVSPSIVSQLVEQVSYRIEQNRLTAGERGHAQADCQMCFADTRWL